MKDKLNARQKKFAEYYAQSGNAAESAKMAVYSEKFAAQNADKLLKNTNISEYIKQLSDKLKDERIISAKDRQVILSDIHMVAVAGNVVHWLARKFYFFLGEFSADVTGLHQFFFNLCKIIFA